MSYSFNSVPGPDQTQEILKSSVAHGLRGKQRLHPEVALEREVVSRPQEVAGNRVG